MQVPMSSYLVEIKPQIQELIRLLEREFDYVSVLCTDVKGTTYRVSMHQTTVGDYHFCERGFVVRAWQDGSYTEYSFNNLTDAADLAEEITSALKSEFQALKALGIAQMESPLVQEEAITKTMQNEIEIDPETVSAEEILSHLRKLCDAGAAHEGILEFQSTVSFARVNKLFLSSKKDLMQSYAFSEGSLSAIGTENGKQNMSYRSCSGLKGVEILNEMDAIVEEIIAVLYDKLHSDPVTLACTMSSPHRMSRRDCTRGIRPRCRDGYVCQRPCTRQRVYRQACCLPALLHARRSSRRTAGQQLSF